MAQHFVQPPHWEWYIIGYFFLAGLAGGCYTIATMLRLWGAPADEATARTGYLVAFPLLVACAILLTVDLGQPLRFWHMMINTTPDEGGLNFKYWSPISVGTWALLLFGIFSFIAYLDARAARMRIPVGVHVIGSILALFIAAYTGVVLSVSNQPVWSDTWTIGGLFVASALSGSTALLWLLSSYTAIPGTTTRLRDAEAYFALLELVMIALFFITLVPVGAAPRALALPWLILWILVIASLVPPLLGLANHRRDLVTIRGSTATLTRIQTASLMAPAAVLLGVFILRIVVILSAQF
jgi:formate-dependent nitrite reductase membrane component NrfD